MSSTINNNRLRNTNSIQSQQNTENVCEEKSKVTLFEVILTFAILDALYYSEPSVSGQ